VASGKDWLANRLGQPQHPGMPRTTFQPVQSRQYVKPEHRMPSNYQTSPDGLWLWNGSEWIPNDQQQVPAPPPPPPSALPDQVARASALQGNGVCPQCGIDDTFFAKPGSPPGAPRRCFSCGYNEVARDYTQSGSFDTTPTLRGQGPAVPGVRQAGTDGNNFAGQVTAAPPWAREYHE
jgi:hypothetical protein